VTEVHVVEQGGHGGVFQHTAQLSRLLADREARVVLHTAKDHEDLDIENAQYCTCVNWFRGVRAKRIRDLLIVLSYLFVTLPHLARATRRRTTHMHGQFGGLLYVLTASVLSRTSERFAYSPHNVFVRGGGRVQSRLLEWTTSLADTVVVYSSADKKLLDHRSLARVVVVPLVQYTPEVGEDCVRAWRELLAPRGPDIPLVVLAGQIRPDKGIDDFLNASAIMSAPHQIAIVGPDAGYLEAAEKQADRLGINPVLHADFLDLRDFVAVLVAADVVVAPYKQASSSGVLALAIPLGTRAVAYPVGGLVESGAILTSEPSYGSLAAALDALLTSHGGCSGGSEVNKVDWISDMYSDADRKAVDP